MVYPCFSYIIWTRKNYISFKSNNKQASKWRKNLKWKQHFYTDASWNYLILNMAVWWESQGGEVAEARREEALMSSPCLIRHHWYDVEKLTVPVRGKLKFQLFMGTEKSFLLKIWKKNELHFVLLHAKASPKSSREGWIFCTKARSLLSNLIFTHSVTCWSCSHETVEK